MQELSVEAGSIAATVSEDTTTATEIAEPTPAAAAADDDNWVTGTVEWREREREA